MLEAVGWVYLREVLLAFFQTHHHTVVVFAYPTLGKSLSHKLTSHAKDDTAQFHLTLLQFVVVVIHLVAEVVAKDCQLIVRADYLEYVTREDDRLAIGDIEFFFFFLFTTHMHPIFMAYRQFAQCLSHPQRVGRHLEFGDMHITVEQMALIERPTVSMHLCLDVT